MARTKAISLIQSGATKVDLAELSGLVIANIFGYTHFDCRMQGNDSFLIRHNRFVEITEDLAFITHPACEQSVVDAAMEEAAAYGAFDELIETHAGCTVSCHCGPSTLGILFVRK